MSDQRSCLPSPPRTRPAPAPKIYTVYMQLPRTFIHQDALVAFFSWRKGSRVFLSPCTPVRTYKHVHVGLYCSFSGAANRPGFAMICPDSPRFVGPKNSSPMFCYGAMAMSTSGMKVCQPALFLTMRSVAGRMAMKTKPGKRISDAKFTARSI